MIFTLNAYLKSFSDGPNRVYSNQGTCVWQGTCKGMSVTQCLLMRYNGILFPFQFASKVLCKTVALSRYT